MRKKIAITGATGFLGKYLVTDLLKDENIDLFLFSTSLEKLKQTFCDKTNLQFVETDYSYNSLKENFADFDTVIHLAAKRLVSNQNALTDYHCNISSTENLMKVCDAILLLLW